MKNGRQQELKQEMCDGVWSGGGITPLSISKALVSEVLDIRTTTARIFDGYVQYEYSHEGMRFTDNDINLSEFALLVKEWAFNQGVTQVSSGYFTVFDGSPEIVKCKIKMLCGVIILFEEEFLAVTEIEAILKMGEFIVQNLERMEECRGY